MTPFLSIFDQNRTFEVLQNSVSTSDATNTEIWSIPVILNSCALVKVFVQALRTGGSGGSAGDTGIWEKTFKVKNIANVVTIVDIQSDYTSEDQTIWDVIPQVSGTNLSLKVKGSVNNNVIWNSVGFYNFVAVGF